MSDPAIRYARRVIGDALNRGGMQAGMPKVTIDTVIVERLCVMAEALQQAEARVAELEAKEDQLFETFVKVADYLGIYAEAARKIPGKPSKVFMAAIARKQAEAVEETQRLISQAEDIIGMRRAAREYSESLRQQADKAEKAGETK